jgi:hypothetical protein
MTNAFELNGAHYVTDSETIGILRGIVAAAKKTGDTSALFAMLHFGLLSGRIQEQREG